MSASALWTFAHRGLSDQFFTDPARFVALLDGNMASAFLEQMWGWALKTVGETEPAKPPLVYGVIRPREDLAIIFMRFNDVRATGEPHHARFLVRAMEADGSGGYNRMFMLEHSEYAGSVVCESEPDGKHRNWGATFAPEDEQAFDAYVIQKVLDTEA